MNHRFLISTLILCLLSSVGFATVLDDFEIMQAQLIDLPDTGNAPAAWADIDAGSEIAPRRQIYVDGGFNGNANTQSSIIVNSGELIVNIGHDALVTGQIAIMHWSDRTISTVWGNPVDLSSVEKLVLEVSSVSGIATASFSLRDQTNFENETLTVFINAPGTYEFDFEDFDDIDFSVVDIMNVRFGRAAGSGTPMNINVTRMDLVGADEVFSNGFENEPK